MTPEKQRIAIAEHLGFKPGTFITETHWFDDCVSDGQEEVLFADHETGGAKVRVPDFLEDLNAMRRVEQSLTRLQRRVHGRTLQDVTCWAVVGFVSDYDSELRSLSYLASASAAQRAEAFLKTVGKWEGAK